MNKWQYWLERWLMETLLNLSSAQCLIIILHLLQIYYFSYFFYLWNNYVDCWLVLNNWYLTYCRLLIYFTVVHVLRICLFYNRSHGQIIMFWLNICIFLSLSDLNSHNWWFNVHIIQLFISLNLIISLFFTRRVNILHLTLLQLTLSHFLLFIQINFNPITNFLIC